MPGVATSLHSAKMSGSTADRSRRLATVFLLLLALVFGAVDQYLGSLSRYAWAADTSLLAGPWLVFSFLVGCTQRSARRACVLAVSCTYVALVGFIVMTLSPVEHAKVSLVGLLGLLVWQVRWFLLGTVSAVVFGWLGHRWRTGRAVWPTVVLAATLCLEPIVRHLIGQPTGSAVVRWSEIGVGVAFCLGWFLYRYGGRVAKIPAARTTSRSGR